jgi:hypothetical protein
MSQPEAKPSKVRNLTYEYIAQAVRDQRDKALAAVPSYETIEASMYDTDAKGKPVLDKEGRGVLVTRRVLKHDLIKAEWAQRVAEAEKQAEPA